MNCLITAGPTYEPLDKVRRLTNFSTGRLGTELANFLTAEGHEVTLLIGEQATYGGRRAAHRIEVFTTTEDLRDRLRKFSKEPTAAVFHAAAVSDFSFGKLWQRSGEKELVELKAGKVSSRLEGVLAELVATPKIIGDLRGCFGDAWLVGWKYEVDGDRSGAIGRALEQLRGNRTNATVVNGPAYGSGFGVVGEAGACTHLNGEQELFDALEAQIPKG